MIESGAVVMKLRGLLLFVLVAACDDPKPPACVEVCPRPFRLLECKADGQCVCTHADGSAEPCTLEAVDAGTP